MTRAWIIRKDAPWRVDAVEITDAEIGPGQVLIEVEACAIGDVDLEIAAERGPDDVEPIPGRAAVGRVIAGVDHLIGKRVLVGPAVPCGECDVCRRAGAAVCPTGVALGVTARGALAERVVTAARWVLPLEDKLALPGVAATVLAGDAALAYALYARAGIGPGDATVVLGDGAVARCLVEILVAKSAPPAVVVRDNSPADWIAWLGEKGATVVTLDHRAADPEVRAAVLAAMHATGHGDRPWKLLETSGDAARQTRVIAMAGPCATVVLASPGATGHPAHAVELGDALDRDVTIVGVAGAHPDLLVDVVALAVRGELDAAAACNVVTPAQLGDALARRHRERPSTQLVVALRADR